MENVVKKSGNLVDLTTEPTEISDDDIETIGRVNFTDLPSIHVGSTKQPLNHMATSMAKGGNAKLSSSTENSGKKIGDIDDQTKEPRKTPSSIGKKSPERRKIDLSKSLGKEVTSDTDDDDENDDLQAVTEEQAMKSLTEKHNSGFDDDEDDNDDFEGMFL